MSYRIEEKIPMTLNDAGEFLSCLRNSGMQTLYPKREISSDYFDTNRFCLFRDSEEGLLPRKKVRIRHYPFTESGNRSLEIKISSIEGRFKEICKLTDIEEKKLIANGYFDPVYGLLEKKINVSYTRSYFEYGLVRITCDTDIKYIDLKSNSNLFYEKDAVIEIKAPEKTSLDYLIKLIPSKRRRFSKYCNAIKYLRLSN